MALYIKYLSLHAACLMRMDREDGSDHRGGCILTDASAIRGRAVIQALNQEFTPGSGT